MIRNSFTLRVLIISFLVLALPLLVDSFIFFQDSYFEAIREAKMELREVANFRTFALSEIQPIKQVLLKELIYLLEIGEKIEDKKFEDLTQKLSEMTRLGEDFQIFILSPSKGVEYTILAASDPEEVGSIFISYNNLKEILETKEGSFIRYIYSAEKKSYVPYIFMVRVIISPNTNKPAGFIMVTADIQKELFSVLDKRGESDHVQFALLNADGIVFAATNPQLDGQYFDVISPARREEIIKSRQLGAKTLPKNSLPVIRGEDPPFFEFIFNDQVQIAYRAFVPHIGISIVSYAAKEEFFGRAIQHFLFIYIIYGLILILGGGVAYWLSLWISRPLRQLSFLMGEVSRGNLDVRFREEPLGFEINILGGIFNDTIDTLLQNIQKAEDERVKKETYQKELAIGRQVQESLLPATTPEMEGAEVAGLYLPAKEVGGDFYGFQTKKNTSGEKVCILTVADAVGKGISSCLYSLSARSLFRAYGTLHDDIGTAMSLANNAFIRDTKESSMVITATIGMYHIDSKLFTYYSCGHVPAIVRRADGQLVTLAHSGMALGLKESEGYPTDSIQLKSGDLLLMYTRGLVEAANEKHQQFTERRVREALQTTHWSRAQEAADGLAQTLREFTGPTAQEDEVIIVVLKVE